MQIIIDYRFTSHNDYIAAERTNKYICAEIKKRETEVARISALNQDGSKLVYPVEISCTWFRTDARTDPDNIEFAIKFILDGLVKARFLMNDNWNCIKKISHEFELSDRDYVIVNVEGYTDVSNLAPCGICSTNFHPVYICKHTRK